MASGDTLRLTKLRLNLVVLLPLAGHLELGKGARCAWEASAAPRLACIVIQIGAHMCRVSVLEKEESNLKRAYRSIVSQKCYSCMINPDWPDG